MQIKKEVADPKLVLRVLPIGLVFATRPKDLGGGLRMRLGDILHCKHPQYFLHFFV